MSVILEELLWPKYLDSFHMDNNINANLCYIPSWRIKNTSFKCNVAFWNGSIISSCSNLHTFICIFIGFTFAAFFRHAISALRCSANNPVQFFSQNNGFKNQFWIKSWYKVSQKNEAVALLKQQATASFLLGHPVALAAFILGHYFD